MLVKESPREPGGLFADLFMVSAWIPQPLLESSPRVPLLSPAVPWGATIESEDWLMRCVADVRVGLAVVA